MEVYAAQKCGVCHSLADQDNKKGGDRQRRRRDDC
jgi:hypothetical protein